MGPKFGEAPVVRTEGAEELKNPVEVVEARDADAENISERNKEDSDRGAEKIKSSESLRADVDSSLSSLAKKKFEKGGKIKAIASVLGINVGERISNEDIKAMQDDHEEAQKRYIEARQAEGANLSPEEQARLAMELFTFKTEQGIRLNDEISRLSAEKSGSYALTKVMKNTGNWLSTSETGKGVLKGASLLGTAISGVPAMARMALTKSPKIAMEMGAGEKIVGGLEKVAGVSKFLTPVGAGKAVAGLVEKWQKSYAEKNAKKFEMMTTEEQTMRLMSFNKSAVDRLMGVLTSKRAVMVAGGIAGLAFVMTTGDVSAAITEGHFDFGGGGVSAEHISEGMSEKDLGNLEDKFVAQGKDVGEVPFVVPGEPGYEEYMETKQQESVAAAVIAKQSLAENVPTQPNQEAPVPAAKIVNAEDAKAQMQRDGMKSGKISFGSSNKMPEPESIVHSAPESARVTETAPAQPVAAHVAEKAVPAQQVAENITKQAESVPAGARFVENSHTEAAPQPARVSMDRSKLGDEPVVAKEYPPQSFGVERIIPNVPGAKLLSMEDARNMNPVIASRLDRLAKNVTDHFGSVVAQEGPGETVGQYVDRMAKLAQAKGIEAKIFKSV